MRSSRYPLFPLIFTAMTAWAQPGALDLGQLMDVPVARTLAQGEFAADLRIFPNGGLLSSILIGLTDRFGLGISYGGSNIIGIGKLNMDPRPCAHVQYLIFDEQFLSPSVVIGFQSQGYGGYNRTFERFAVKSKGFYVVASKNTSILGGLGLHVGANYSLENRDKDKDVNAFAGFHKWINPDLVILGEYDAALNDNSDNTIGSGKGYLNAGVRWSFVQRFFFEFSWKNILENRDNVPGSSREVKLVYMARL